MIHKTIMIVEDEYLVALDLQQTFEDLGWRVIGPASTVDRALRLLDLELPLVALLDINIGNDLVTPVAEYLKQHDIPFAFTSASAEALVVSATFGAVVAIGKPFTRLQLKSVVNKLVSLAVIEAHKGVLSDECEPVSVSPTPPEHQAARRPRHSARAAARVSL